MFEYDQIKEYFTPQFLAYWLISVVFVGILINIVSSFLFKRLDADLSRISEWWRNRSEKKQIEREKTVQDILANERLEIRYQFLALNRQIEVQRSFLFLLVFSLLGLVLSTQAKFFQIITLIGIVLFTALVLFRAREYQETSYILHLVNEKDSRLQKALDDYNKNQ